MQYIKRKIDIVDLLKKRSVILLGPRQTGKTSYIINEIPQNLIAMHVSLLDSRTYRKYFRDPAILADEVHALLPSKDQTIIVIDEIQKIPQLLDEVHLLIDEKKYTFLLTGSSARKLKKRGVNLLGGRASKLFIHPFSYFELAQNLDLKLEDIFERGMLPFVWEGDLKADNLLSDYVETYIKDEIVAEGVIRNLPSFEDFLHLAALSSGQELNYSNIARDVGLSHSAISGWYQVLEDSLLGFRVEPWKKSTKRKASAIDKFYMADVGLVRYLSEMKVPEEAQTEYGRLFESFIAVELKTWIDYTGNRLKLSYWRTEGGTYEVDFILGDDIAIEVKSAKNITRKHTKALLALAEEKIMKKLIIVCNEDTPRLTQEGILILPWKEFVKRLWNETL